MLSSISVTRLLRRSMHTRSRRCHPSHRRVCSVMSKLCPPSRSTVSSEWPRIAAVGARRSGPRRASCMHAWSTCSPARRAPARGSSRKSFPRAGKFHHNIWCETKGFTSPLFYKMLRANVEQCFTIWAFEYHRHGLSGSTLSQIAILAKRSNTDKLVNQT